MTLFDSHAHMTHSSADDIDGMAIRARNAGVTQIVNICTDQKSLEEGIALSQRYPWIYNAAATTPHDVDREGDALFPLMAHHARNGDLVAVGETGLDYHYTHSKRETQQQFLRRYLALALECNLPLIIHCREAFSDLFAILDDAYRSSRGVLHCFTGTLDEAHRVIARGWYLSLSGIVTFKKSEQLREVAKATPLTQLLIETDAPYLAPQSRRGQPNEPAYLGETAQMIADVKGITLEEVAQQTRDNAEALFQPNMP